MLVPVSAALALFTAPAAAEGAAKPKPAMERVCHKITVVGSTVPRKQCVNRPVKTAETAENAEDKAQDAAKTD